MIRLEHANVCVHDIDGVVKFLQAVLANLGVGVLPDYLTEDFPQLVRVLPEIESGEVPVFLAYPEELRQSKRVAAFRDFVQEEIFNHRRKIRDNETPS